MWYWEIVFKTKCGQVLSLYSIQGFKTEMEAECDHRENGEQIDKKLKELGCVLIYDEQLVFRV